MVQVRRSQGFFHSLQATHDLERPDQVKCVSPGYSTKATVCCSPDHVQLWLQHLEAEHHAALDVFGDVAVGHPVPGAADIEQDVDDLTGPNQNGVLPDEVGFRDTASVEYEEATRAVNMERGAASGGRIRLSCRAESSPGPTPGTARRCRD
jgi:hypothetical protein